MNKFAQRSIDYMQKEATRYNDMNGFPFGQFTLQIQREGILASIEEQYEEAPHLKESGSLLDHLMSFAYNKLKHICHSACPSDFNFTVRDEECIVCQILMELEKEETCLDDEPTEPIRRIIAKMLERKE